MKNIIRFFYVLCCALLLTIVTGCGSTYSGSYSSSYYGGHSLGYDSYYRSGVSRNYNRSVTRARVSSPGRGGGGRGRR